jgi:hypothetical protein
MLMPALYLLGLAGKLFLNPFLLFLSSLADLLVFAVSVCARDIATPMPSTVPNTQVINFIDL